MDSSVDFGRALTEMEKEGAPVNEPSPQYQAAPQAEAAPAMSALVPLKAELASYEPQINELLARAQAVTIQDDGGLEQAVAVGGKIKDLLNAIEKRRKEVKAPALEFGRAVDRIAKAFLDRLASAEKSLKEKISVFDKAREQEGRRIEHERQKALEETQRRLNEEAANGGFDPVKLEAQP